MNDPVLQRSMFKAPVSEDSQARAGMYAVAKATDEFSNKVQGAQDYEQLMNTIRGDNKTIEDRRHELAGIVGLADAQRTPVTVLAVMQPAIELLQQKSQPGGITSLVEGESEQPEAPAQPEAPQGFADGGFVQKRNEYNDALQQTLGPEKSIDDYLAERQRILGGQDNSSLNANLALMQYGAGVATTPGNLITALAKPLPEFGKTLSGIADKKADRDRAIRLNALEARDKDKGVRTQAGIDALRTSFTEANANQRTQMQIDATSKENALNRDLTRGEGAANRDLTRGEGAANRDLTRTEGAANRQFQGDQGDKNRDLTRTEGAANRDLTRGEGAANRQFQGDQGDKNRDLTRGEGAANRDLTRTEGTANRQFQADQQERQFNQQDKQTDAALAGTDETMYTDGTRLYRAKKSRNGMVDAVTGKALDANLAPLNETTLRWMNIGKDEAKEVKNYETPDGTIMAGVQRGTTIYGLNGKPLPADVRLHSEKGMDITKPYNVVVTDPNAPGGVRQVLARSDGRGNTQVQDGPNGTWVPMDPQKKYAVGDLKTYLNPTTEGGRTTFTPLLGESAGTSQKVEPAPTGNINNTNLQAPGRQSTLAPDVAPVAEQAQRALAAHKPEVRDQFTIGAITGEGAEAHFVKKGQKPYVTYDRMSTEDRDNALKKIDNSQKFIRSSDDFLKAMPEAMGPWNQVKSFSTNVLAPITPQALDNFTTYLKTEQAKRDLQNMRQSIRQAEALNPRFPVGELSVIDDLAENPDKFLANPQAGMARLQESIRIARNNIEYERARLENREPLFLERVPTGTAQDPFQSSQQQYLLDLKKNGMSVKGLHVVVGNKIVELE